MKYVDFFTSNPTGWDDTYINRNLLIMDGVEYRFPYRFSYKTTDGYKRSINITIEKFNRAENYIWGDDRIYFSWDEYIYTKYDEPPTIVRNDITKKSFLEHVRKQEEYDRIKENEK